MRHFVVGSTIVVVLCLCGWFVIRLGYLPFSLNSHPQIPAHVPWPSLLSVVGCASVPALLSP